MLKWDNKLADWIDAKTENWSFTGNVDEMSKFWSFIADELAAYVIPEGSDRSPYEQFENGFNLGADNCDKNYVAFEYEEDIFIVPGTTKEIKSKISTWLKENG